MIARPCGEDLRRIARMIDDNTIRSIVERIYDLEDAPVAHRTSEAGHVRGKLVLSTDRAPLSDHKPSDFD
jgi:NADPH:quinone reductase-like Zn-dependent oxidoreductase